MLQQPYRLFGTHPFALWVMSYDVGWVCMYTINNKNTKYASSSSFIKVNWLNDNFKS